MENDDLELEEQELDSELDSELSPEQLVEKNKKLAEMVKQAVQTKKNWRDKAVDPKSGKLWSELANPQSHQEETPKKTEPDEVVEELKKEVDSLKVSEQKRTFGYDNGFSPAETDMIWSLATANKKKPEEMLTDETWKLMLDSKRTVEKTKSAIPHSSSRTGTVNGKNFDELPVDEQRKNWGTVTGAKK